VGETWDKWRDSVKKTIDLNPDSVTVYQMELPFNTTISADVLKGTGRFNEHVASWSTKRRWVDDAFNALERAGYTVGSAYTAVKDPGRTHFIYRDRLWQGADLAGLGVASSGTSTACTCKTSTPGNSTAPASAAMSCRSAVRTIPMPTSG